uniref:Putative conserved secreted protein n=1 Tax=Rhipicephalus microplus TaxID=6941 RepID=A0A6M2CMM6_RHIMP
MTIALSLLVLAAVCSADSEGQRDCSSSECAEEKRDLSAGEQGSNAAVTKQGATHRAPASPQPAHDSHQQDSSSQLLKVNFWLTLLISALAAALLS